MESPEAAGRTCNVGPTLAPASEPGQGERPNTSALVLPVAAHLFFHDPWPAIVGASIAVFDLIGKSTALRDQLEKNVIRFRSGIEKMGFKTVGAGAAIVPVMLGDARLSQQMADKLLDEGIYVIGFFYPVVPKGQARIRVQLSAAHSEAHVDKALAAFEKIGKELGVI